MFKTYLSQEFFCKQIKLRAGSGSGVGAHQKGGDPANNLVCSCQSWPLGSPTRRILGPTPPRSRPPSALADKLATRRTQELKIDNWSLEAGGKKTIKTADR